MVLGLEKGMRVKHSYVRLVFLQEAPQKLFTLSTIQGYSER